MSWIKLLNLFLFLVTVVFVTSYYDRFERIETFFYYLGWWIFWSFILTGLICLMVKANKGPDDGD